MLDFYKKNVLLCSRTWQSSVPTRNHPFGINNHLPDIERQPSRMNLSSQAEVFTEASQTCLVPEDAAMQPAATALINLIESKKASSLVIEVILIV